MLLRYFYDEKLAHASYLVGCQRTGEAIVIEPSRDITPYLQTAKAEGLKIVAATETHIHADFVSGARQLAEEHQVKLYLSDEGDENWKYLYLDSVSHQLLKDGDQFTIGNLVFGVMHTPGHTPESISFLLTDRGGQADKPMGIFTGDFVFVGDVGRPDLLEKAAGVHGTADIGARQMFHSLNRFKQLPDYMQVWPSHGAGSACGKALGAVPSTTVGYEKLFNWALQYTEEEAFVQALLQGQPEPPKYFAVMKQVNKTGPNLFEQLATPVSIASAADLQALINQGEQIIDTRTTQAFAQGHAEGTINIPYNKSFVSWAGWIVDYNRPLYLLADAGTIPAILRDLRSIGIDNVAGYMDLAVLAQSPDLLTETYQTALPREVADVIASGEVTLIDVRNQGEWEEGHIPGAQHIMLGTLASRLDEIATDKPIVVQCRSGARSAIAASILQANGIKNVTNLTGGYLAWEKEGLILV
ncbi:MBL fold metallo-hydrolase [Brevibacillus dissolubilis]|uniref:MBL fold metallo-hydrolase n=1 Tax=Brevibacillus dissolubilis TaxID=1844116 RepID=UPI0011179210|nr:MBL fold metallo-hydrolase [Brevibacillus dissolubilis]